MMDQMKKNGLAPAERFAQLSKKQKYLVGAVALNLLAIAIILYTQLKLVLGGSFSTLDFLARVCYVAGLALISLGLWKNNRRAISVGAFA